MLIQVIPSVWNLFFLIWNFNQPSAIVSLAQAFACGFSFNL